MLIFFTILTGVRRLIEITKYGVSFFGKFVVAGITHRHRLPYAAGMPRM
jgi:hypothetical protein